MHCKHALCAHCVFQPKCLRNNYVGTHALCAVCIAVTAHGLRVPERDVSLQSCSSTGSCAGRALPDLCKCNVWLCPERRVGGPSVSVVFVSNLRRQRSFVRTFGQSAERCTQHHEHDSCCYQWKLKLELRKRCEAQFSRSSSHPRWRTRGRGSGPNRLIVVRGRASRALNGKSLQLNLYTVLCSV